MKFGKIKNRRNRKNKSSHYKTSFSNRGFRNRKKKKRY